MIRAFLILILAVSTGHPGSGALTLLAFGVGTLPNLLGIGLLAGAAARVVERPWIRQGAGALTLGFGLHAWWQILG